MSKKLNIVDFAFVILILLILFGISFKIFFVRTSDTKKEVIKTVYYKVENARIDPKIIPYIKVGSNLYNNYDKVEAWITNVTTKPSTNAISTADGRIVQAEDYSRKDLIISIKARVIDNKSRPYLRVGTQDLIVGQSFTVKTNKVIIRGTIVSIK